MCKCGTNLSTPFKQSAPINIPSTVINRARAILEELESGTAAPAPQKAPAPVEDQVSMLDLKSQAICAELEKISVETLTPIEAMNELYRLKKMLS